MIARAEKPRSDPPPIWKIGDIASYLDVSDRQALRWVQVLLAFGLRPISNRPVRCFQDDFVNALRAHAAERIERPAIGSR